MAEFQTDHAAVLLRLGRELLLADSLATLLRISAADPVDRAALIEFDDGLWGPSLSRIADNRPDAPGTLGIPRHGSTRCDVQDRDVFRPLHYCAVYLTDPDLDIAWVARSIVEMSSAHLEQLVKRIGPPRFMPLGVLLRETIVRRSIEPATWGQLWNYRAIYNASKHEFAHTLGTHLFLVQDAIVAYIVARRLGQQLYPLAKLTTDWRTF